jgi:hypothetical protein
MTRDQKTSVERLWPAQRSWSQKMLSWFSLATVLPQFFLLSQRCDSIILRCSHHLTVICQSLTLYTLNIFLPFAENCQGIHLGLLPVFAAVWPAQGLCHGARWVQRHSSCPRSPPPSCFPGSAFGTAQQHRADGEIPSFSPTFQRSNQAFQLSFACRSRRTRMRQAFGSPGA